MADNVETSGNANPALLILVGSVIGLCIVKRNEIVDFLRYDPVSEAQRIARKAIGIREDDDDE